MSNLPTYMILDDHEIEEAWTPLRQEKKYIGYGAKARYASAFNAYECYQRSHSPLVNEADPRKYWYEFESAGYNFFVLDTRTQRDILDEGDDTDLGGNRMIHGNQFDDLKTWLDAQTSDTHQGSSLAQASSRRTSGRAPLHKTTGRDFPPRDAGFWT